MNAKYTYLKRRPVILHRFYFPFRCPAHLIVNYSRTIQIPRYVYLEKADSRRTFGHLGPAPYTVEDGAPVDGLREMHRTIRTNGRYKSVPSLDPTCEETRNTKEGERKKERERRRDKLLGGNRDFVVHLPLLFLLLRSIQSVFSAHPNLLAPRAPK